VIAPAGSAAATIAEIGVVLIAGSTIIFIAVMLLLALALRRRMSPPGRPKGEFPLEGTPISEPRRALTRVWVIGGGVVFPVLVLSALLAYATVRSAQLTATQKVDGLLISVTAKMWWWEVRYRDPRTARDIVLANEIRLPVGRPVMLGLTTSDVIHSFWVPALAGKVDMVPGRVHQLRIEASEPGVYRGQCAEFCGEQHAKMAIHVVALAPDDFERWLDRQQQPAVEPGEASAQRGLRVFKEQRCDACHTVRGLAEASRIGPDLTHVGSRLYLGAGTLLADRNNLREWIAHIQRVKPGARMPSYERLDGASLHALATFLDELK